MIFVIFPVLLLKPLHYAPRNQKQKLIFNTSEKVFVSYFPNSPIEFHAGTTILLQIKVFDGKTNGTKLEMFVTKITVHSSFNAIKSHQANKRVN